MYLAFKWLTTLALAMWLAMCVMDIYVKNSKEINKKGLQMDTAKRPYRNFSAQLEDDTLERKLLMNRTSQYDLAVLHYAMFFAGAIAVSVFNKKREIITFTKNTMAKIDISAAFKTFTKSLKKTVSRFYDATLNYSMFTTVILKTFFNKIKNVKLGVKSNVNEKHKHLNLILLRKLKDIDDERKKLGQLLIAAIRENKNIRTQFQLENMAKNRLVRHIEDTQEKIKENRSKYVCFQHLYLVTHQENMFLKARILKLTTEKERAEKDLMEIIYEVYRSKNNDLKSFCSRFIVLPKENLLNSDVGAEVQKFLQKSYSAGAGTSCQVLSTAHNDYKRREITDNALTDLLQPDDSLVPVLSGAPKLKGLPGECIWTVKDKDGIIEKLYECDYESDFENGETIQRIRQYSVYYDKDCLLDFSRSSTVVTETYPVPLRKMYPTSGRFLTGSEAFQKFLQNNRNVVLSSGPVPPLLS